MTTDPFEHVLRPVAGEYQEISQATYVELISVRRYTVAPAVCREGPGVERSLRRVAFGRGRAITDQQDDAESAPSYPPNLPRRYYRPPTQVASASAQHVPTHDNQQFRALVSNADLSSLLGGSFRIQDASVSVSGLVWHDVDGTGEQDPDDPALGEWQVFIDIDDSHDISGADLSTYTGTGVELPYYRRLGTYSIDDVPTGPVVVGAQTHTPPWRVRLVLPESPPGQTWRISYPVAGHHLVDPSESVAFHGLDFGVTLAEPSSSECSGICPVDLAIVLDESASMGPVIDTVKSGIRGVVDILQEAIGLDFRLALVTFQDLVRWRCGFYREWGESVCGKAAINLLQSSLNNLDVGGGGDLPEWSARALKFTVEGGVGAWRDSAARVAFLVTDALNKPESGVTVSEAAQAAADAGVQVIYAAAPPREPGMIEEGRIYAEATGGTFVETDSAGSNLPELLTSYLYSLCGREITTRTCEGGMDEISNGRFDTGIEGWTQFRAPISWSSERQSLLVERGADARQTIVGLEPGDRVVLIANITCKDAGDFDYGFVPNTTIGTLEAGESIQVTQAIDVPESGQITVRFRSELSGVPSSPEPPCDPPVDASGPYGSVSGTVWHDVNGDGIWQSGELGIEGVWVYADLNDSCTIGLLEPANITDSDGNFIIYHIPEGHVKIRVIPPPGMFVSSAGEVDDCDQPYHSVCVEEGVTTGGLSFGLNDTPPRDAAAFYVDDVVACVYSTEECGPGSNNAVRNANFSEGVRYWDNKDGTALPETDPAVWDALAQALIVNVSDYEEVRTTLGVLPGGSYLLSFDIISSQPEAIQEVSIQYGILNSSDEVVADGEKSNSDLGDLPHTVALPFTAPSDGVAEIFIRSGDIGGVAKIKNVLVCDPTGLCEPGSTRLTYDDFNTGRDGWGGIWEDGAIRLFSGPGGGTLSTSKQFTDLEPGSLVQVSLDLKSEAYADLRLISDGRIDQKVVGPTPGRYHHEAIVQSDGTIRFAVGISGANYTSEIDRVRLVFDNVLVCVTEPISCEDNVQDLRAFVKWQGVPRNPWNVFNSFVRYVARDPASLQTTEYNYRPTIEQRAAAYSCDFWRQEGVAGELQDDILQAGLNPNTIGDVTDGEITDVTAKVNWLWSIPLGESEDPDQLMVHYPPPPAGLIIESVSIFLLEQYCTASGDGTVPVLGPNPCGNGKDPGQRVTMGIRYRNNFGESKEFSVDRHVNQLWQQKVDLQQHAEPWDNIASTGYGYKAPLARWDQFSFLLDFVDGSGLDQCTIPVESDRLAVSAGLELVRMGMNGVGFFLDELNLPFVDPGPHTYPLPEGRTGPVCQSQPVLHRPGPDDGVPPSEEPCCTPENIPTSVDQAHRWRFERDLFDPHQPGCKGQVTVRDLALRKGLDPSRYRPYVVDKDNGTLVHTMYTQIIRGRQTVLLVENDMNTDSGLIYIRDRIMKA